MKIGFVHANKAFLPALNGYPAFFSKYAIECEVIRKEKLKSIDLQAAWFFMGIDQTNPQQGICKIHEYISPSTPPFRKWKDKYKSIINSKPDCRIFKNEYVRSSFSFQDKVPFYYQDIGIAEEWLLPDSNLIKEKEFDFIYVGELSQRRKLEILIDHFTHPTMQRRTLLLLGKDYTYLQNKYQAYPNIIFRGPVEKHAVQDYILKSRFGVNYMPDIEPFNQLTSTKLLEYAACGIPVISSDYAWIKQFQQQYGGNYFYLKPNLSNLTWDNVTNFQYSFPDLSSWTWEQQIKKSGVLEFLQSRFPELKF